MQRQVRDWENTLAKYISDKVLVLLGTTQWAQDLNRYFTKENIQMYTTHKKRHPQCD